MRFARTGSNTAFVLFWFSAEFPSTCAELESRFICEYYYYVESLYLLCFHSAISKSLYSRFLSIRRSLGDFFLSLFGLAHSFGGGVLAAVTGVTV